MSEQANILARILTDMDQKLNALGEQQKALDSKLERYSAFTVKKLNDSVDTLCNMQEAQLKLLTESLTKIGRQVDVMEKQVAAYMAPDVTNGELMQTLTGCADELQDSVDRCMELVGHHSVMIERNLMDEMNRLNELMEADMRLAQDSAEALSQKLSLAFTHLYGEVLNSQDLIENPDPVIEEADAVPENPEAVPEVLDALPESIETVPEFADAAPESVDAMPENPDGVFLNPEIAVFEKPDAVIQNGNETEEIIR